MGNLSSHNNDNSTSDSDNNVDCRPGGGGCGDEQDGDNFKPLERMDSLFDGEQHLSSLADSIRLIYRRDSNRTLTNEAEQNARSPWLQLKSPPMISSPHHYLTNMPEYQKRREDQVKLYYSKRRAAQNKKKRNQQLQQEQKQEQEQEQEQDSIPIERIRTVSLGSDPSSRQMDMVDATTGENFVTVKNEEDQWERKREDKLRKVIEKSASGNSLSYSMGSTTSYTAYSPSADIISALRKEFEKSTNPMSVSVMYGLVNAMIVLPVIMSFGNIIYQHEFFRPYLPILIKLTLVSGVVHQLCFSMFSTLPFAVGSVQDAGLIFLSTIASGIVKYCQDRGCTDEEILATALVGLPIFTAVLGVCLIAIGYLKLAGFVQVLPTTVVGGYLAFIGFFCGQSALSLLSHVGVSGVLQWYKFMHIEPLMLIAPGVLGGVGIFVAVRNLRHMATLPLSIALLLSLFYLTLQLTGTTRDEAKEQGWMSRADAPPTWYHTWDYIQFDKVIWAALPGQAMTALSMIFVVALSSSLDIAAIDLELPKPLEYNYELRIVGLSNFISGITGGYTGSYIFSQTIFSLRAGIRSRLCGFVVALLGAVAVVVPVSIQDFVPNFIFASLLIMICVDLMIEWLWDVRKKLSKTEFSVTLMTFIMIQALGVEYGIIAGIVIHIALERLCNTKGNQKDSPVYDETTAFFIEDDKYKSTDEIRFDFMDVVSVDIEGGTKTQLN